MPPEAIRSPYNYPSLSYEPVWDRRTDRLIECIAQCGLLQQDRIYVDVEPSFWLVKRSVSLDCRRGHSLYGQLRHVMSTLRHPMTRVLTRSRQFVSFVMTESRHPCVIDSSQRVRF